MSRHELRIVILALVAIWAIALALWWSALWQAAVFFAISGADLPQLTTIVLRSAYAGGPFIVAAFLTAAALHLIWRPGPRPLARPVWLLVIMIAVAVIHLIALTLPMTNLCGDFVPPRHDPTGINRAPACQP